MEFFLFTNVSRLALGPTQPPIQCVAWGRGSFAGVKMFGTWSWPLTSIYNRAKKTRGAILLFPNMSSLRGA